MKVLLTGASGFLGRILQNELGAKLSIYALGRQKENHILCDLSMEIPTIPTDIEAVIHAAGRAHIYPKTEAEKQSFFDVNVKGTKHLLEALENTSLKKLVFISSVSVYGLDKGNLIEEANELKGNSPYAKSKIEAEKDIQAWCETNKVAYLILRLPLVVGENALGNLGKMIEAIKQGKYVRIAKGKAQKSMVLASDIAQLIFTWLHNDGSNSGVYNITDGYHPTFFEMEEAIRKNLKARFIPSIPTWLGVALGKFGDIFSWFPVNSGTIKKITGTFTFSDKKARKEINWKSTKVLDKIG